MWTGLTYFAPLSPLAFGTGHCALAAAPEPELYPWRFYNHHKFRDAATLGALGKNLVLIGVYAHSFVLPQSEMDFQAA